MEYSKSDIFVYLVTIISEDLYDPNPLLSYELNLKSLLKSLRFDSDILSCRDFKVEKVKVSSKGKDDYFVIEDLIEIYDPMFDYSDIYSNLKDYEFLFETEFKHYLRVNLDEEDLICKTDLYYCYECDYLTSNVKENDKCLDCDNICCKLEYGSDY